MYYAMLRTLLRDRPDLRNHLKRCLHCRIFFLTDHRNVKRTDLRCGFGCREAHRRAASTQRSVAHYRQHTDKKRKANQRRYRVLCESRPPPCGTAPANGNGTHPVPDLIPTPILEHVRLIVSLIERRPVAMAEIMQMLAKKERQHRMVRTPQRPYGVPRIRNQGS
jgi:hypothetical protein